MNIFRTPTVEETVKDTKRSVSKTQRQLGRDSTAMDREEKGIMLKIKDAQKRGNQGEMRILAKQIVQLRKDKEKIQGMSSKLGTVKTQATMMQASHAMSTAMASTAKTMKAVNKAANPEKMQANMMDFQRQMAGMEMTEEMLDDTLSGAFDDQMEDDADEIVRRTLEEIGVDATKALGPAPAGRIASKTAEADEEDAETERLMKQLLGS